ncbi:MAG: O-antigen ligase family protein [Candidatus Berkelbacteria bacterium]|nr:O-antigen ligase family protein [Candidatus Berkelbacteria bacterium]
MKSITRYLAYITILALPLYIVRFSIGPIPTTVLEVLIYLTFLFSLFSGSLKGIFKNKLFYFGLIFVAVTFIGVLVDPDKTRALGLYKAYFVDGFLLFTAIINCEKEEKKTILNLIILAGLITSLNALLQYYFGIRAQDNRLLDLDRLSPNYLAMFISPILILSLGQMIIKIKEKIFYLYLSLSLVFIFALFLTGSRGAIIGVLGGAIILISQIVGNKYSKKAQKIFIISSLILLILATAYVFKPKWSDMGRAGSSSNIRYYIWSTSVEIIKKNPILGVGLSNFQDYFSNLTKDRINYPEFISPQALTAHNLYIQLYLAGSIFSLIAFVIFVASVLKKNKNAIVLAALVAILVYGLVDTPIFKNDLAVLFWIVLAIGI